MSDATPYHEALRPQFHFTAREGWLNDPNGLVWYDGEYHLFYQFVPPAVEKGWGHAVSKDLLHWEDLGMAIPFSKERGQAWSGSIIVDHDNVLGLQGGALKTMVAFFTGRQTWGQYCFVSSDRGRNWRPLQEEPVLPEIMPGNRDPKVFFHAESGRFVMVLWCRAPENTEDAENPNGIYIFFTSEDLVHWQRQSSLGTFFECPDLFKLPIEGESGHRWVLVDGKGDYLLGAFDGTVFTPETDRQQVGDHGANFYATQTWNDSPDARVLQLTWMRNSVRQPGVERYPGMPFDQQMTIPCALTLRRTKDGLHVYRTPVRELEALHGGDPADCADIRIPAGSGRRLHINRGGVELLDLDGGTLQAFDRTQLVSDAEDIRVFVDRVSVEIFIGDGERCLSFCYLPRDDRPLTVVPTESATVRGMASIWD